MRLFFAFILAVFCGLSIAGYLYEETHRRGDASDAPMILIMAGLSVLFAILSLVLLYWN